MLCIDHITDRKIQSSILMCDKQTYKQTRVVLSPVSVPERHVYIYTPTDIHI